ncbi:hypothetical protein [Streptomyces sp. NPDC047525]|uniref:hypothetical protein n=1 Tax=Streptomyces sp. NPDC047525 TaxID=3155264 RepID=UPI0033E71504
MQITTERARELNSAAYLEQDPITPATVVAGVAVHAYVDPEDGQVVVSVHLDTGDVPDDVVSAEETVPPADHRQRCRRLQRVLTHGLPGARG